MIVRTLEEIVGTEREVDGETWVSRRLVLADDQMGYSVHDTVIRAGTETHIHYRNHLETVYCIAGHGEVETVADGRIWPIGPDTVYVLDQNDEHYLRAHAGADMRMVCVFRPALTGREKHDASGAYPAPEEPA